MAGQAAAAAGAAVRVGGLDAAAAGGAVHVRAPVLGGGEEGEVEMVEA